MVSNASAGVSLEFLKKQVFSGFARGREMAPGGPGLVMSTEKHWCLSQFLTSVLFFFFFWSLKRDTLRAYGRFQARGQIIRVEP